MALFLTSGKCHFTHEVATCLKNRGRWRYVTGADSRSTDSFAGANPIRAMPTTTSTAEPMSSPRAISPAKACPAISIARTKLDHAVNAIRLRFADGQRDAKSKKMPRVTYTLKLIGSAVLASQTQSRDKLDCKRSSPLRSTQPSAFVLATWCSLCENYIHWAEMLRVRTATQER